VNLEDLKDKKVAIWGSGVEGQAVFEFIKKQYPEKEVGFIENNVIPADAEVVVRSPGVSIYLPAHKEALSRGVKFTTLINLFLNMHKGAKVIGVTGTKGKSTVVSMLAFMLQALGFKVGLGGNIGVSPLSFLGQNLDYIVLELSSFQTADLEENIDAALVTNVSKAHLDWHLTHENYVNDKLKILKRAKHAVLNYNDERLKHFIGAVFYGISEAFHVENGEIFDRDVEVKLPKLQVVGEHNLLNLCGVLAVLKLFNLDYMKAIPSLKDFLPLEHRLQKVYERNGIEFIDDSIATVPDSVIAGLEAFKGKDVALIAGGYDNGSADYGALNEYIKNRDNVKAVLCLPDTGRFIAVPQAKPVPNMKEAVLSAIKNLPSGGVVLLSPAAPSFNMYKNYKERGEDFAKLAKELCK